MIVSFHRAAKHHIPAAIAAAASLLSLTLATNGAHAARALQSPQVTLADGVVEGVKMRGEHKEVRIFRGIPYAAPPVGDFRFREPQPVARWAGVRNARQFGPRCMQSFVAGKLDFRSTTMSEDCLYLNVWTSANGSDGKLPVLVYFHGGAFVSGDGSEPRYDGAQLASRGAIVVTANYRLGAFGFLAAPGAASESSHGTAGNYGLLDQVAVLKWVRDNIAQFGGDPSNVTIAGNSAGSTSVSAHMASPLSRGLFARVIGHSGAAFAPDAIWSREEAERAAKAFTARIGAASLQQLRSLPAKTLLTSAAQAQRSHEPTSFKPSIDGHFLTESPEQVFTRGGQAQVPLLLGSNAQDAVLPGVGAAAEATVPGSGARLATLQEKLSAFRDHVDEGLALYPGSDKVSQSTRRWMDLHRQTGQAPVFYYRYTQRLPAEIDVPTDRVPPPVLGRVQDAQVPYALGNLDVQKRYTWTAADYDVSRIFSRYIERFVKTGDPNGTTPGAESAADQAPRQAGSVPNWPASRVENQGTLLQIIGENTHSAWDNPASSQDLTAQPPADSLAESAPAPVVR
ncbi:carboxylesterase family protein [Trinickia sp. Y13]|uniref:carboxylesterase/lipase family protein n=1 Tax=Trinickia sp. Y13 TaxID=2917807 RepID=UPI0024052B5D|nr:carboxylesterase family protein [Trinickia sp. Y13]MDG0023723.1 carboxylesterase family protein [Trinickia sp. Y13]